MGYSASARIKNNLKLSIFLDCRDFQGLFAVNFDGRPPQGELFLRQIVTIKRLFLGNQSIGYGKSARLSTVPSGKVTCRGPSTFFRNMGIPFVMWSILGDHT
jgi:hypothetical protein